MNSAASVLNSTSRGRNRTSVGPCHEESLSVRACGPHLKGAHSRTPPQIFIAKASTSIARPTFRLSTPSLGIEFSLEHYLIVIDQQRPLVLGLLRKCRVAKLTFIGLEAGGPSWHYQFLGWRQNGRTGWAATTGEPSSHIDALFISPFQKKKWKPILKCV